MKKLIALAGVTLAALFFYYAVTTYLPRIQSDILEKAQGSIRENGLSQTVAAFVDGRDVVLDGVVSSETQRQLTENRIQALEGVRVVTNNLTVEAPMKETDSLFNETMQEPMENPVPEAILDPDVKESVVDLAIPNMPTDLDIEGFGDVDFLDMPEQNVPSVPSEDMPVADVSSAVPDDVMSLEDGKESILPVQELIAKVSEASRCQERVSRAVVGQRVSFETGKAVVKADSFDLLKSVVTAVDGCDGVSLQVHGHTDNVGESDANRKLSHARARAVGMYLLKNGVVQEVRIFGHGADRPIATNDTQEGRAQNRRIEFKVVALKPDNNLEQTQQDSDAQ